MRLRDHYDWIVLGDDPGALLSASLVSKLGLSVLILPLFPETKLEVMLGDKVAEEVIDFETNYVLGLDESGLWNECLKQVGMTPEEGELISRDKAVPQVVTRQGRLALWPDRARFGAEVDREFGPGSAAKAGLSGALRQADPAVREFWRRLPERLTLQATKGEAPTIKAKTVSTLQKLFDQLVRSEDKGVAGLRAWRGQGSAALGPGFAEVLEGIQAGLTCSQAASKVDALDSIHLLALSSAGASYQGGLTAFRDLLLRLARRNGATIPVRTECRRIFIQGGRFAGVLPSNRGSMISATGGVLGLPIRSILPILTQSGRTWFRGLKSPSNAMGWKFTITLRLHPEAIPPGVPRRLVWQEHGAPFLEIERASPADYGLKDRQSTVLFLRTLMPMTEESLSPIFQRLTAARLLRKATEILPFLEFHIQGIYPDFRNEGEQELQEIYGFKSLDEIPAHLICYRGKGPGAQSGVEGLFLSSRESLPTMGTHGWAVSALEASAWIAHRTGLPGPLKG